MIWGRVPQITRNSLLLGGGIPLLKPDGLLDQPHHCPFTNPTLFPSAMLPDLDSLSLAAQIAQMVVVRASGFLFDHQIRYPQWEAPAPTLRHWITDLGVGGVILLGGSAAELGVRTQQLQAWSEIPLLLAADVEEGVGQRFSGATWFPPPMALGAIARHDLPTAVDYAQQMGYHTAQEAQAIGLNWVLAPVVDVNNNPGNPVINVRAFGDDPAIVRPLIAAFIAGAKAYSVLTTAKHFPGHGDTAVDSHLELPVLPHRVERLAAMEWPPFEQAIAADVDSIMTAHLLIPALDPDYPATLSRRILTDELRKRLGFEGLIVTDALIMGAIADGYGVNEAPVLAVEAGADILLMPGDPAGAIAAVYAAVEAGRIPKEQIRAAVERIWRAKLKACSPLFDSQSTSHAWEHVPPPPIQLEQVAQPAAIASVNTILYASMQVHCPTPVPILSPGPGRNLVILDNVLDCKFLGRHTPAIAYPAQAGYTAQLIDGATPSSPEQATHCPTLLQLFIRGNPFRGSAGLTQVAQDWFHALLRSRQLQALVIYGSPYVLEQFVPHLPADLPYVFTYGQMEAAQAIALQALGVSNHAQ